MAVNELTDGLTTGTITGTGSFDVLMRAVKEHLKGELDDGRIRQTDYANAYVEATSAVLAQATQFTISQSRLAAEVALIEAQTAQVIQETKTSAQQEKLLAAQTSHTTKEELHTVQSTINLVETAKQIKSATAIQEYQLLNILPVELANLTKTGLNISAQTELATKQGLAVVAETKLKDYQLLNVLPLEVANLSKTGLALEAQTANTIQQTANLVTDNEQSVARHVLELQSLEVQIAKVTTDTVVATKQAALIDAQAIGEQSRTQNTEANTRQTDYETNFLSPAKLIGIEEQNTLLTKQHEQVTQQTLNLAAEKERIIKQTAQITAETSLKTIEVAIQTFNRDFKQPLELQLMEKDVLLKDNQILINNKEVLLKQAQIDLSVKEIALKESQIALGVKEVLLKQAQIALSEKELLLKAEQIAISKYEVTNKLPAEVALLGAQNSLYIQKTITEKAQVDNTVVGLNSVTDINNKLILEQSKTYLRTFQQNTAKMFIDTWNVRHTADPDGNLENSSNKLLDTNIGRVLDKLATELGIILV